MFACACLDALHLLGRETNALAVEAIVRQHVEKAQYLRVLDGKRTKFPHGAQVREVGKLRRGIASLHRRWRCWARRRGWCGGSGPRAGF
jgi:hypothetical protein